MATRDREPDLERAYALETPDDSRRLYEEWAPTYESGFIEYMGYVYHRTVADLFVAHRGDHTGPVLDAGCGTGVVGDELRRRGVEPVDGLDIAPAMLERAAAKRDASGEPVYRRLVVGDLTGPLELVTASYAGIVSAGTFTHGHVGPEAFGELVRIAAPGALFAIGINAEHYAARGFEAELERLGAAGDITAPELIDVAIYEGGESAHADDRAVVAIFRRDEAQG